MAWLNKSGSRNAWKTAIIGPKCLAIKKREMQPGFSDGAFRASSFTA